MAPDLGTRQPSGLRGQPSRLLAPSQTTTELFFIFFPRISRQAHPFPCTRRTRLRLLIVKKSLAAGVGAALSCNKPGAAS